MAKRARVRENALYLVIKIVERLVLADHEGRATVLSLVLAASRSTTGSSSDGHE